MPQLDTFTFFNQLVYFLLGFFIFYFFVSYYLIPVIQFICLIRNKSINFLTSFTEPVLESLSLDVSTKLRFDSELSINGIYNALFSSTISYSNQYFVDRPNLIQSRYWFILKWYEHLFFSRYLVYSFSKALEQEKL